MDEKEQANETRQCSKTSMGIFYRAHHVYYRAACRAGKGAGGCADSGKNESIRNLKMEILPIPEMEAMEIPTIYLRMPMRLPAMGMKSQFWEVVLF